MRLVSEVEQFKRQRRKARQRRERIREDPPPPGTLPEFIARTSPDLAPLTHLDPITERIVRVPVERVELCFSAPPRMGKSTLLQHLVAWLLILNPKMRIAVVSYGADLAAELSQKAKAIYLRAGGVLGSKQTEGYWFTRGGGCVLACGLDGPLTGRGFHLVICDDAFKNEEQAYSRTIREKIVSGYKSNVYSRKNPRVAAPVPTSYLVCHTRWIDGDLVGALTDPASEGPWDLINLPAIRDDGSALNPDFFTLEDIARDRRTLGEFAFAALHMGTPRPIGGSIFGDVATFDRIEEGGTWKYAIGIDIPRSARARSDGNVAVVMRQNVATKVIEVIDVRREKGTLTDKVTGRGEEPEISDGFLRTLHGLTKLYPGAPVCMYGAKDETLLVSLMARHDKYPVRVRHTLATAKKWIRAAPYSSAWSDPSGRLRVLRTAPWFATFVKEHVGFTGSDRDGEVDDQIDAAVAAYDALVKSAGTGKASGTGAGSEAARIARYI